MRISFKLKIALLSFVSSGIVFALFAGLLLSVSRHAGLTRMQRQMRIAAESVCRFAWRASNSPGDKNSSTSLKPEILAGLATEFAHPEYPFALVNRYGKLLYASTNCPPALALALTHAALLSDKPEGSDWGGKPGEPPGLSGGEEPPDMDPFGPHERNRNRNRFDGGPAGIRHQPILHGGFRILATPGANWYVLASRRGPDSRQVLITACNLGEYTRDMRAFLLAVLGSGLLGLTFLAAIGWWLADWTLKPLLALTAVANRITSRDLRERVNAGGASTEFAALIEVINSMLDRLENSFQQAQRFSADAAHELKTPLAILQGMADQAIRHAPPESPELQFSSDILDEVQRLKSIVNKLLLLSQSDAGKLPVNLETVSMTEQVQILCEDLPLLAKPDTPFTSTLAPDVNVRADRTLLRQALQNLFSNAAKYNRAGGTIACVLTQTLTDAILEISNAVDPGSAPDTTRLFERFYRGDPSHTRAIEGTGLGLSLAREVILTMGGTLTASLTAPDQILFRLTLPLIKS